jgi:ABC-type transport system substrate-binding protein
MDAQQAVATTTNDQAARAAAYHRIEGLVMRDNPLLVFWWQRQQEAIRTNFTGFAPSPVTESWNAWQWGLSR